MAIAYTTILQSQYQRMFDTCTIDENKYAEVDANIKQIYKGKSRYENVAAAINIPWYFIGIVHRIKHECDFKTHLHNGDSLNGRTINVPVGHPKNGRPPFAWEVSAEDALRCEKLDKWTDWSLPGILYKLEVYNNFQNRTINTAYLWRYSNHCLHSKLPGNKEDELPQCGGAAVILRRMAEKQLVQLQNNILSRIQIIKQLAGEVSYLPNRFNSKVQELQRILNLHGVHLREDGRAGKITSDALHSITDYYLQNDPRFS